MREHAAHTTFSLFPLEQEIKKRNERQTNTGIKVRNTTTIEAQILFQKRGSGDETNAQ